jgi:TPR repeat protein
MNKKMKKLSHRVYSTAMRLVYMKKYGDAKRLIEIASDLCEPSATYTLGCFYEFGIGVKCDKAKAYEYYEKAAALKFKDARSKHKLAVLKIFKDNNPNF